MIASEDANRWNLLAVERLAEIGRLEALISLVNKGEPPVDQTILQGNDDSSLLKLPSEPLAKEAVEVEEPATGEPEEEAIAPAPSPHLTREQLGEHIGGKSRETIRQWEVNGKLALEGWELVPGTGTSPKNPRLYRPLNRNQ